MKDCQPVRIPEADFASNFMANSIDPDHMVSSGRVNKYTMVLHSYLGSVWALLEWIWRRGFDDVSE